MKTFVRVMATLMGILSSILAWSGKYDAAAWLIGITCWMMLGHMWNDIEELKGEGK